MMPKLVCVRYLYGYNTILVLEYSRFHGTLFLPEWGAMSPLRSTFCESTFGAIALLSIEVASSSPISIRTRVSATQLDMMSIS